MRADGTESGDNAFSGRSLADNAVTPFLRDRAIPISASPYLSSLRGGAKFVKDGAPRIQRDKEGFDALVTVIDVGNDVRHLHASVCPVWLRGRLRVPVLVEDGRRNG